MSRRDRDRERDRDRDRDRDLERYARDSDSRRRRSGFDREPSPKRSRREENPETERVHGRNANSDVGGGDNKNRRRVQDAFPLGPPSRTEAEASAPAVESSVVRKELSDKKPDGNDRERNHLSDPTQVPRSRSYFQHDERGTAGLVGRSFGRRAASDREQRDLKDDRNERATKKSATYDLQRRDDKLQPKVDDNDVWRHDGFLKMEAQPPPPRRKRPAFREKKVPLETEISKKEATGPAVPSHSDRPIPSSERRDERDHNLRNIERSDKSVAGGRREAQRGGLPSRDRYGGGGGNYRERDRYNGRQDYRPRGTRGEKWKHDLFDEADKSPNTKNEEDQIAKVEALLAS